MGLIGSACTGPPSRCISTTDMSPYRVSTGGVESGGGGGNLGVVAGAN
jgi:hypothetical protein